MQLCHLLVCYFRSNKHHDSVHRGMIEAHVLPNQMVNSERIVQRLAAFQNLKGQIQ